MRPGIYFYSPGFTNNTFLPSGPQKYSAFKELLRPNKGVVLFESIEKARAHFRKDKDVFSAVIHCEDS